MKPTELIKNYKGQATYQILVKGKVNPDFMKRFNNLVVTHSESRDEILSTMIGDFEDQEALSGVLNILFDHRYPVISVMKIDTNFNS